ncbi:MAG: RDD family protein [Gloeotrichia echinulata GP01]
MHLFNRIKFNTPESVELEFTLAGIGNRAWALLIDYHVLALILVVLLIVWGIVSVQLISVGEQFFGPALPIWLVAITIIIYFVVYVGYFVFFETIWQGQTPGKRLAKIRVVRDDGRPVGLQQTTLRALLRPFDEFLFLGALLIIFNRSEKRLGDLAAGTIVIQAQTPTNSANFSISEQANLLHKQLVEIADFSQLLPDDFAIIREYLQRRNGMSSKARALLATKLSQQVQNIINLDNLPQGVSYDVFLEAIYLAYRQKEF